MLAALAFRQRRKPLPESTPPEAARPATRRMPEHQRRVIRSNDLLRNARAAERCASVRFRRVGRDMRAEVPDATVAISAFSAISVPVIRRLMPVSLKLLIRYRHACCRQIDIFLISVILPVRLFYFR